jgi:hypothetical protein
MKSTTYERIPKVYSLANKAVTGEDEKSLYPVER